MVVMAVREDDGGWLDLREGTDPTLYRIGIETGARIDYDRTLPGDEIDVRIVRDRRSDLDYRHPLMNLERLLKFHAERRR